MTKVLFVPGGTNLEMRVVDLKPHPEYGNNPYFMCQPVLGTDMIVRVTTPHEEIHMFVDENGHYKPDLPVNPRASAFYPGQIIGDVVLMRMKLVFGEEGPDFEPMDIDHDFVLAVHRHFMQPIQNWTP